MQLNAKMPDPSCKVLSFDKYGSASSRPASASSFQSAVQKIQLDEPLHVGESNGVSVEALIQSAAKQRFFGELKLDPDTRCA